jgi:hypothetical protein
MPRFVLSVVIKTGILFFTSFPLVRRYAYTIEYSLALRLWQLFFAIVSK